MNRACIEFLLHSSNNILEIFSVDLELFYIPSDCVAICRANYAYFLIFLIANYTMTSIPLQLHPNNDIKIVMPHCSSIILQINLYICPYFGFSISAPTPEGMQRVGMGKFVPIQEDKYNIAGRTGKPDSKTLQVFVVKSVSPQLQSNVL